MKKAIIGIVSCIILVQSGYIPMPSYPSWRHGESNAQYQQRLDRGSTTTGTNGLGLARA